MKNVLVTDDEKSFLTALTEALGGDDGPYHILTAENGIQAVEHMESKEVDLLITDLRMPVMDGFELLAWVSTNKSELPVIVMTAFADEELDSKLRPYNTINCLEKPINFNVLRGIVKTALTENATSNIHGVTLSTFLQLMSFEKKTCTLIIRSEGRTGNLYLNNGELINADYGDTDGMKAAIEILGWDNTEIEMDHVCKRYDILINSGIESILLEAFSNIDEQGDEATSLNLMDEDQSEEDFITSIEDSDSDDPAGITDFDEPFEDEPSIALEEEIPIHVKEMLVKKIYGHKATEECCLFNHENLLEEVTSEAACSQVEFDPAIFLYLTSQLDGTLALGELRWIHFTLASRNHYLFFKLRGCSLLVKLIRGARPQVLGAEFLNIVQMVIPNN